MGVLGGSGRVLGNSGRFWRGFGGGLGGVPGVSRGFPVGSGRLRDGFRFYRHPKITFRCCLNVFTASLFL